VSSEQQEVRRYEHDDRERENTGVARCSTTL